MKRTQLYLTKEQEILLRRLSRERNCSISDLVREAIDHRFRPAESLADVERILAETAGLLADWTEDGETYVTRVRDGRHWNQRLDSLLGGEQE